MKDFDPVKSAVVALGFDPAMADKYNHIFTACIALAVIVAASIYVCRRLRDPTKRIVPDERPTLLNFLEIIISAILKMIEDIIGKDARAHLPLIGSVFIFILTCNLLSVLPGFKPPTENMNTTLACAITVFVYYNAFGIRKHGLRRYLRHLCGPVIWIAPLMFMIELVSHFVRPLSLSVRLFGNMTGDHMVLGMFSELVPLVIPVIFMLMAIFVAFIQAFVFTLLSIIYISLASGSEEHA